AGDDLLIVHANPTDVNQIIYPSEVDQLARYGEIRQSDAALEPLVMGAKARTVAFGHLHVPNVRVWRRRLLVNVSSVSMPGDSDPRAKYALLTWMNGRWMAEHRRVEVGAAGLIAAFRAARPPHWPDAVAALETDGYYYPQRV
uniref:metallophosphoesterase family protein n=1 Tax=Promineifilum sp. TaxID=2664178 RepID=UPI0035B42C1A